MVANSPHNSEHDQNEISRQLTPFWVPESKASTELKWGADQTGAAQTRRTIYSCVALPTSNKVLNENPHEEEVSTALVLYDESWIDTKKRKIMKNHDLNAKAESTISDKPSETFPIGGASKPASMGVRCTEDNQGEKTLSPFEDPWKIKKRLTGSDLDHLSRLLLRTSLVKDHVLPFLGADRIREVESNGMPVTVWDQDSESEHQLVFKRRATSKSYVFIRLWRRDFVIRRDLKQGDVVGIYWDCSKSRFNFCVLERAR